MTVSHSPSVVLIKFADDATVEGLITGQNETIYRQIDGLVR